MGLTNVFFLGGSSGDVFCIRCGMRGAGSMNGFRWSVLILAC